MTPPRHHLRSLDLSQLARFASSLTRLSPAPSVVGLVGTLGAGKTTLVQLIAEKWGVDRSEVTSPTFTLVQAHAIPPDASRPAGPERLNHLDAYRIADEDEFLELGVDELMDDPQSITLIEWADRVASVLPRETLWIALRLNSDPNQRDIELSGGNPAMLDRLCDQWGEQR